MARCATPTSSTSAPRSAPPGGTGAAAGRAQPRFVLSNVRDKVVQDVDNSEDTGTSTVLERVRLHVLHPLVAASHMLRVASADAAKREAVAKTFGGGSVRPGRIQVITNPRSFIDETVLPAVYVSFLHPSFRGYTYSRRQMLITAGISTLSRSCRFGAKGASFRATHSSTCSCVCIPQGSAPATTSPLRGA
jgi:hypothetical protein